MGAQMTKELGLYNEEEKVSTPTGSSNPRFRKLNCDPRSATSGIIRTPIQIEQSPESVKSSSAMDVSFQFDSNEVEHSSSMIESINELEKNSTDCSNSSLNKSNDVYENDSEPAQTIPPTKYLETDIDQTDYVSQSVQSVVRKLDNAFAQPENVHQQLLKREDNKIIKSFPDVRSPSLEINRTPVMVVCTPELFALHSRIESLSFCDFDTEDPSVVVSEDDQSSHVDSSTVNNWLVDVENKAENVGFTPFNDTFTDSPKTVAKKQKELNALKKKLFFTPDVKETTNLKVRTPLGNLQAGQDSPQRILRSKQWRNIQEERQKLGLSDAENTPPSLPPLSKISSAPGKMIDRKRSNYNWSHDNTMLI